MRNALLAGLVAIAGMMTGCSSTRTIQVAVPPRVDLAPYRTIGLVTFSSSADPELAPVATQKFLQSMQQAQPGTRVIELGREQAVFKSVDRRAGGIPPPFTPCANTTALMPSCWEPLSSRSLRRTFACQRRARPSA